LLELDEVRLPRNENLDFFSDRYRSSHGDHGKQSDDDHQNVAGVSRGEAGCAIVDVELWLAVAAVLGIGIWVLALSALVDSGASALTFLTEVMAHQFGRGRRGWPVFSAVTGLDLVTGGTLVRTSASAGLAAWVALDAGAVIVLVLASSTRDHLGLDAISFVRGVARLTALVARFTRLARSPEIWGCAISAAES